MMKKALIASAILFATAGSILAADTVTFVPIKGRVMDNEQNPLPGAIVKVDGNNYSAVTDIEGYYTLSNLPEGQHVFYVSYLGFAPAELPFSVTRNSGNGPEITLQNTSKELSEIIITGVFSDQSKAINSKSIGISVGVLKSKVSFVGRPDQRAFLSRYLSGRSSLHFS